MSVLDELEIKETRVSHVLAEETSDIDSGEEYAYTIYMDTLTRYPETDVRMTIDMLKAIFSASHYIFRYRIESITISKNSYITKDDVPEWIQIIESEYYEDTGNVWSRYKMVISFDFKTQFKTGYVTLDWDKVTCIYGVLRFLKQLVYVCGRSSYNERDYKFMDTDLCLILMNNETTDTYELKGYSDIMKIFRGDIDSRIKEHLKRFVNKMDSDAYQVCTDSQYDDAVYRYMHRSEVWRLKRDDWNTIVLMTPQPNSVSIERTYGLDDSFFSTYQLTIKGYGIADLYLRYNLLRAVCTFSVFNKLFVFDKSIEKYADLFWHMSPEKFRNRIETYFDEQNFSNMWYAQWVLKRVLEAYDEKGYSAVIDVLSEELNSKLIASKVKVRMK